MRLTFLLLAAWCFCVNAGAGENVVQNPGFETDADANGVPDRWQASGDSRLVTQALERDAGREGGHCVRLSCTAFQAGSPAAHAMLCQMGVPVRRGVMYRISFWARAEEIEADVVSIKLSDTSNWSDCGLDGAFVPTPEWKRYEFLFRGARDSAEKTRLQIWFTSTGTLWVDDIALEEAGRDLYRPGQIVPAGAGRNLVPNASFECGTAGWGSAAWDRTTHWAGNMNRLFGTIDGEQALDGRRSLRIDLSPDNQPVSYFDYYELHRTPLWAPLAANVGYLEVEPDSEYTLSGFLRADAADCPARLAIRPFEGSTVEKGVRVSTDWQRFELVFRPRSRWCYVLVGPDLRKTEDSPSPPPRARLWLDAIQLERSSSATPFVPRQPIELGVSTDKPGNVFNEDEPVRVRLSLSAPVQAAGAEVELRVTDFVDLEVWQRKLRIAEGKTEIEFTLPADPELRGFLRLHASLTAGAVTSQAALRMAVIPVRTSDDSRFGVNHAYPWPHLLDLCRQAGLAWVRDWSLKWQDVEPEPGGFTFAETDHQIDRPRAHGLQVLGLLPFPSSNWSSSAGPEVAVTDRYPQNRARVAYAPRDEGEFERYVERTVGEYRGRITWWQVFNEPLFTDYSLPRRHGYTGADYARWTKAFARAARRANPDCRVLAGIGYLDDGAVLKDFEQFFAAGGLAAVDAVDVHHYPRLRPPEFADRLLEKLNALMERHGGRKPIWLTEYGYYADDDPSSVPMPHSGFDQPLEDEITQAAYAVRWAILMMAGGVEKIFYHAGTCDGVNQDSLQGIFFEYGGQPHKIYAAQAVLAHLFPPSCRFVKRLDMGPKTRGYLFRDGDRALAAVWAEQGAEESPMVAIDAPRVEVRDVMGRPIALPFLPLGPIPVYVQGEQAAIEALARAAQAGE